MKVTVGGATGSGILALVVTASLVAATFALLWAGGVPVTCDPPRHEIVVPTIDGFGHHECVLPTSPPGTPPASTTRR